MAKSTTSPVKASGQSPPAKKGGSNPPSPPRSPPRKANPGSPNVKPYHQKTKSANQVMYKTVNMENVGIGYVMNKSGTAPAFLGQSLMYIEDDPQRKEHCKIYMMSKFRNTDGSNSFMETTSASGNTYNTDLVVFVADNETTLAQACINFSNVLCEIARNECKDDWNYGIPTFVPKGNATPPNPPPLSFYLTNEDCITVIKGIYENCDTKDEFEANEFYDQIVHTVFGDLARGNEVIQGIPSELWDQL